MQTFANKVYGRMAWIMPVFVAFATIGSANGLVLTSSRLHKNFLEFPMNIKTIFFVRLFFVGGRAGQMPQFLTMINENRRTPMPAVALTVLRCC